MGGTIRKRCGKAKKSNDRNFHRYVVMSVLMLCAFFGLVFLVNDVVDSVVDSAAVKKGGKYGQMIPSAVRTGDTHQPAGQGGDGGSEGEWSLILVNKWNPLPEDYRVELTELSNGQSVDKRIYPSLQKMFDTARSENIWPVVASGYRTAQKQQELMDEKIAEYQADGDSLKTAQKKAKEWVAVPGTSEHQSGLGVDINADGVHSKGSEVYDWLEENGYQFGFVRRYPKDKTDITGIVNEPWHYRYVGIRAAEEMHRTGVCLEEYLQEIKNGR